MARLYFQRIQFNYNYAPARSRETNLILRQRALISIRDYKLQISSHTVTKGLAIDNRRLLSHNIMYVAKADPTVEPSSP